MDPDQSQPNEEQRFAERLRIELAELKRQVADTEAVSPETLARIAQISALIPPETPPPKRWPLAAVFVVTGVMLSVLFFVRLPSSRIEVTIRTSELSLRTANDYSYPMPERLLSVELGPANAIDANCASEDANGTFDLENAKDSASDISIAPIRLPAHTLVTISHMGSGGRHQLNVIPPDKAALGDLDLTLAGKWRGQIGSCKLATVLSPMRAVKLRPPTGEPLYVAMTPRAKAHAQITGLAVDDLSLVTVDNTGTEVAGRVGSHLKSGTLRFPSIGDKSRALREGENFRMLRARGDIQLLTIGPDAITFRFSGIVDGLTTDGRNLMPTCFDWLSGQHGLVSLWGALLYVAGVVFAILHWWRPRTFSRESH